ncbi:MAG TPA: hypothetical protein VHP56_04225 [Solirubrobacterales bacterium]|jgi:hypothetical protein|nr:hypothetical protein [Solirubrobacterales bacterium]
MRIVASIAIVAALAFLAGCGGSDSGTTGAASTDRAKAPAKEARAAFLAEPSCKRPPGASRWGCSIDSYRCQAVVIDRGWSVTCSRPGRSVAFVVRR